MDGWTRRLGAAALVLGVGAVGLVGAVAAADAVGSSSDAAKDAYIETSQWVPPNAKTTLPAESAYDDTTGKFGVLNTGGPVNTAGHPFFTAMGPNGRACVTCHQPSDGMSISVATIKARWDATGGKDPLFAAVDGSNCPNLPQDQASSHSLLLNRGLFRISLPWPPKDANGRPMNPEFKIEVVQDPTSCNTSAVYGLNSPDPHVSVYRRPRPLMNMKYIVGMPSTFGPQLFSPKNVAEPMAVDPDTGKRSSMQLMADARDLSLRRQAMDAAANHLQMAHAPTDAQLQQIVDFEMQVYGGQVSDAAGGSLQEPGGPKALGPRNLSTSTVGVLGDNYDSPAFFDFEMWKVPAPGESAQQSAFRQSVARGRDIFMSRPFWIRDVQFINTVGLGNPVKRTCVTCHNTQMMGMDLTTGWGDIGIQNLPWAEQGLQSPLYKNAGQQLPLFKITCKDDVPPHMFLGRVIYTHDPGRALISGRCRDVGSVVMQQFRGLAARAPYFSNGEAANLRELVDFYDRRFNIGFSEQEKTDLINFLSVL